METILYRAKRKDNGEWIEGYYAKAKWYLDDSEIHVIFPTDLTLYPHSEFSYFEEIIPETLGRLLSYACYDGYQECERLFQNDIIGVWDRRADVDNTPLLDTCTVFLAPITLNWKNILALYISGFPVNMSQGLCTFAVLFLLGRPLLDKLDRIKIKYGMMEDEDGI